MASQSIKGYAVVGLGTFGASLCVELSEKGAQVLAIDNQSRLIEKVKDVVTQSILLDSTDEEAMGQIPFEDVDTAVVAIGDNIEASILTTAILKKIGIPRIIARSITDIHQEVLRQVGADEVINLEIDEGTRLAQRLLSPEILDNIPISENFSLAEMVCPREFAGKTLITLDLRRKMNVSVVALRRTALSVDEEGNTVRDDRLLFPQAGDEILEGDILLVVGANSDLSAFRELKR